MINSYLIGRHEGRSKAEYPHDGRKLESLFIHNSINGETSASRATRAGGKGGGRGPTPLAEELGRYFFSFVGICLFFKPPVGGEGGSEQSDRTRPERKRWGVNGQARVGEGVGELSFRLNWWGCRKVAR